MACNNSTAPQTRTYENTARFLMWNQFPALLEKSIKYFAVLPKVGKYRRLNPTIVEFGDAIHSLTTRQFTMSGVGSLIDFDRYGNQIKRPSPQLQGTGCSGSSLCADTTCFSMREGVIESNNVLQQICWSMSMGCLKDHFYSDTMFDKKMNNYFNMFFAQALAVTEAFQRTSLLRESIKIVCTNKNIALTGGSLLGLDGMSVPFYMDVNNPTSLPDITAMGSGVGVGGANLQAFIDYLARGLFAGAFDGGMPSVDVYGLDSDYNMALRQTASVFDSGMSGEYMKTMIASASSDVRNSKYFGNFTYDGMFPRFTLDNVTNILEPITQEILMPSTLYGYEQTYNPKHGMAKCAGLLLVPSNWRYNLVAPPNDDFSYLGLGQGLNFRTNSPGVYPIASSSMFSRNRVGRDGVVTLGDDINAIQGLEPRDRAIQEAVRTELLMTYQSRDCNDAYPGQLPNAARNLTAQSRADGFKLQSEIRFATAVEGRARPILLLFQRDQQRSAVPIEVCSVVEQAVSTTAGYSIMDCCPGNQVYTILTFNKDVSSVFTVGNSAVYRSGANGISFLVTVTAVSGAVVTVTATNGTDILPCCSGSPDDYGTRAELIKTTGATALTGVIMKALCDPDNDHLALELFLPVATALIGTAVTITLTNRQVINTVLTAAISAPGVFLSVEAAPGESCDLCALDCSCLVNAIISIAPLA